MHNTNFKKIKNLIKSNLIFIIILTFGILLRLNNLDYPLLSDEPNRDYLISRHIVEYKEFISLGPNNGTLTNAKNSPLYNYFLASLLWVKDDLMFLTTMNFIFQIISLILIYIMTKKLFGKNIAVISSAFLSFGNIFLLQSVQIWQPYEMFFFLTLSVFFIFKAWETKRNIFLFISPIFFAAAIAMNMSSMAFAPSYFMGVYLATKHKKNNISLILISALIFEIFVIGFNYTNQINGISTDHFWIQKPKELFINILERSNTLLKTLNLSLLVGIFIIFLGSLKRSKYLLFSLFSFIFVSSLIQAILLPQHFYPVLPIFVILISQIIESLPLKPIVATIFILIFYQGAQTIKPSLTNFDRLNAQKVLVDTISKEVVDIKESENYNSLNFFQFRFYDSPSVNFFTNDSKTADAFLWTGLEKNLNTKFTTVKDFDTESRYEVNNSDKYIFLVCRFYESEIKELNNCLSRFSLENKDYLLKDKIVTNMYSHSIYLFKNMVTE